MAAMSQVSPASTAPEAAAPVPWAVVSRGLAVDAVDLTRPRRLLGFVATGALIVLVLSALVGVLAAQRLAEREAVNDAGKTADLLGKAVVEPALTDGILEARPSSVAKLQAALSDYMSKSTLVRVKVWTRSGTIVYSDEPRLIGRTFSLDTEQRGAFSRDRTRAEVSDLNRPENQYERGQGRLLEAYRPVRTPSGTPLLFETYSPYTEVDARAGQLGRSFAAVTVSSLVLFAALLFPLLWHLIRRLRAAQRQRERLLERAVEASVEERHRIAGTLHDGVVQELAAASFGVAGAAARVDGPEAGELHAIAATLRDSIGGLRTLLVDIYPETLETAGLVEVLRDLAGTLHSREIDVRLDLPESDPGLDPEHDRLIFRIAHECLTNVQRHAAAHTVWISLRADDEAAVLEIADDGIGFDAAAVLAEPAEGHFGIRILADAASSAGSLLEVASAPGAGCRWRLRITR
jgi:two-component system NarL family sensor kinase